MSDNAGGGAGMSDKPDLGYAVREIAREWVPTQRCTIITYAVHALRAVPPDEGLTLVRIYDYEGARAEVGCFRCRDQHLLRRPCAHIEAVRCELAI